MLVPRSRLAIAGVINLAAITVPAAELVSRPGSPSGKPVPPQASAASTSKSAAPQLAALAASAGISVSRTAMHQGDSDVCQR